MTIWIFLIIISAAFILMQFGWLLAMVGILALATKFLVVVVVGIILGVAAWGLWRLFRNRSQARTPRLIFRSK